MAADVPTAAVEVAGVLAANCKKALERHPRA